MARIGAKQPRLVFDWNWGRNCSCGLGGHGGLPWYGARVKGVAQFYYVSGLIIDTLCPCQFAAMQRFEICSCGIESKDLPSRKGKIAANRSRGLPIRAARFVMSNRIRALLWLLILELGCGAIIFVLHFLCPLMHRFFFAGGQGGGLAVWRCNRSCAEWSRPLIECGSVTAGAGQMQLVGRGHALIWLYQCQFCKPWADKTGMPQRGRHKITKTASASIAKLRKSPYPSSQRRRNSALRHG